MTDGGEILVERLRRKCTSANKYGTQGTKPINPDGPEAADRIEILEKALREIATHESGVSDNLSECGECHDAYLEPYVEIRDIARAVLTGDNAS
jgi:hypothetical protein